MPSSASSKSLRFKFVDLVLVAVSFLQVIFGHHVQHSVLGTMQHILLLLGGAPLLTNLLANLHAGVRLVKLGGIHSTFS